MWEETNNFQAPNHPMLRKSSRLKKYYRSLLVFTHICFLIACVVMAVFCMIRFVLPISFEKTSENFMIFMIPSSITQSSISAAGLFATTSTLSWPLMCFSTVQMLPLVFSIYWIFIQLNELTSFSPQAIPMFILLTSCCVTWIIQIILSILLSIEIRKKKTLLGNETQLSDVIWTELALKLMEPVIIKSEITSRSHAICLWVDMHKGNEEWRKIPDREIWRKVFLIWCSREWEETR